MYNKDQAEIRETVYRFLGKCFLELPTMEFVSEIYHGGILQDFPAWAASEWIVNGKKDLLQAHSLIQQKGLEEAYQEIKSEYTRLFYGPQVIVPLWESVYREEDGLTFGRSTLEVRDFYRRNKLQIALFNQEPDDHLGYELEFVATLFHSLQREVDAEASAKESDPTGVNGCEGEIRAFLKEHLMLWIHSVAERISAAHSHPLYTGLIQLTLGLLLFDFEVLREDGK